MKIRILHVIDHLGYGGAPFVVKGLVERMPADRIESLVCALRPNPRPLPIEAQVITLTGRKYSPAAIGAIANLCRSHGIDIVHAHLQKAVISSLLAAARCPSRLILHEHGPVFRGGTGCIYRQFLRRLGPRADTIIANSEAAKAALERTMRDHRVPIAVVPNFVDTRQFDPDRYDRDSARKSLGLDPNQFVIGFVGRLDRAKGADLLVDAAARLRDQADAFRFLVVGEGPEREDLEVRIRRLNLGRTVTLAGLHENTAAVMRAFDAAVVPSRREAFGIAALELMRMKVPVIVSPVGGLPELVQDGRTGIVLPQLAPEAIAQAVQSLAKDAALRERLSRRGFEHASRFDGREQVEQVVHLYMRLMKTGDPCPVIRDPGHGPRATGHGAHCGPGVQSTCRAGRAAALRSEAVLDSRAGCPRHMGGQSTAYEGAVAAGYEGVHGDIFNSIEQQRLRGTLQKAVQAVQTGSTPVRALDFGCGSGNLTRHLLELGAHTVSADVSDDFLAGIRRKFAATGRSETLKLNGADLSNVPEAHFDLAATYSVLHHVPDYLAIVRELGRVVKPGGVLYIDHEVTPDYYQRPPVYVEFLQKARPRVNWRRLLSLTLDVRGYKHILRRLANPRYKREGDIHVWPDDHIEWDKIEEILGSQGFEVVLKHDYLLYKAIYDLRVYHEYQDRCADERVLIARKEP